MYTTMDMFRQLICCLFLASATLGRPESLRLEGRIKIEEVIFTLYTRSNGDNGQTLVAGDAAVLQSSDFQVQNPTKIITHGFMSSGTSNTVMGPKRELLKVEDMNIITVDWSTCTRNLQYEEVQLCANEVGGYVAELLKFLREETGLVYSDVHLLGHSLGAQVMSFVAAGLDGEKPGRLSAMDPAGPLYDHVDEADRLDPGDADFVDVIHTYTILLGMSDPVGTVDFYPNGGIVQPGCGVFETGCNHGRAVDYYVKTIAADHRHDYMAMKCNNVDSARVGNCTGSLGAMGYDSINTAPGIYYINMTAVWN